MSFTVALAVGAALLAAWVDYRCDKLRPASLGRTAIHAAIAVTVLQASAAGARCLVGVEAATRSGSLKRRGGI